MWLNSFFATISLLLICGCQTEQVGSGSTTPDINPNNALDVEEAADNSSCTVCHMDFDAETIAVKHLENGVGCVKCHGQSEPHRTDETLRTRPDLLYGRSEVDPYCKTCHEKHKDPTAVEEFRREWYGRSRPNGRFISENSICTDCHGQHIIPPKDNE